MLNDVADRMSGNNREKWSVNTQLQLRKFNGRYLLWHMRRWEDNVGKMLCYDVKWNTVPQDRVKWGLLVHNNGYFVSTKR